MPKPLLGYTRSDPVCPQQDEEHGEHEFTAPEGDTRWCRGRYRVLDDYNQWILTSGVNDTSYGWLESTYTYYPIDSTRLRESDWTEHMSEKSWVNMTEFRAALAAAQKRWS